MTNPPLYDPKAVKRLLKAVDVLWANLADARMTVDEGGEEYKDMKELRRAHAQVKRSGRAA